MARLESFRDGVIIARPSRGPQILFLELTTRCNFNCIMCFRRSWEERLGNMSESLFRRVLEGAVEAGTRFIWFAGWGEPLVHPKFLEWAEEVKRVGLELGINTNGSLLDEDLAKELVRIGVDRITVSIDAASEDVYREVRGWSFRQLRDSIETIHRMKKEMRSVKPILEFSFTAMKSNLKELPKLFDLAERVGVGRIIVSNVIPTSHLTKDEILYDGWEGEDKLWEIVSIKSLETNVGARIPEFSFRTERSCDFIESAAACVTWDGKVAPCYNLLHTYTAYILGIEKKVKQHSFGDLNREKLTDIWRKPEYVAFRYKVHFFRYPSCADCRLRYYCALVESTEMDCWGNMPTCADCLYGRRIVQCPV